MDNEWKGISGPSVLARSPYGQQIFHFFLPCLCPSFPLVGTSRPALCSLPRGTQRWKQSTSGFGFMLHKPQPLGVSEHRYSVLARSKGDKEASSMQRTNGPSLGPGQGRMWGSVGTEPRAESQAASISPGGNDSSAEGFCPLYTVLESARRLIAEGSPWMKSVASQVERSQGTLCPPAP